jgi:hypothetical protein
MRLRRENQYRLDGQLMKPAMRAAGTATKRETVERGLQLLMQLLLPAPTRAADDQGNVCAARGKLRWDGNLDAMRRAR